MIGRIIKECEDGREGGGEKERGVREVRKGMGVIGVEEKKDGSVGRIEGRGKEESDWRGGKIRFEGGI